MNCKRPPPPPPSTTYRTRKFLTMYKIQHPKSDVERLYPPRAKGGRELIHLELSYKTITIGLDKYLQETEDTLLLFVKGHDDRISLYSISRQSMESSRELGLPAIPPAEDEVNTTYARRTKVKAKHQGSQHPKPKWEPIALHGKYPQRVKKADVDQDKTYSDRWLKVAGLKAETEGFIIAAQDQSLQTRWHQHNILKKPEVDPKCRLCGRFNEAIDHLVSGCPELAKTEYIHRHNTCTGRSAKSLVLRWRNDGMSMNPWLSPRRTASPFCGTYPSTLTGPSQLIGRTLC